MFKKSKLTQIVYFENKKKMLVVVCVAAYSNVYCFKKFSVFKFFSVFKIFFHFKKNFMLKPVYVNFL